MSQTKKRGLGRGLDALLGMQPAAVDGSDSGPRVAEEGELKQVPLDALERGRFQPRVEFDEEKLEELASSIRAQGVVQPIVVRPLAGGRFEIIAGERRYRASLLAGLTEIPALVREVPDEAAMSIALIENIQREQLNPVEEARALSRLIHEFDMTHQAVADAIGRSRSSVSNLLRLLDLDDALKAMVERGELEMGHARALLGADRAAQLEIARDVVDRGLSVRATEKLVKDHAAGGGRRTGTGPARKTATPTRDPDVEALEADLSDRLGARVSIRQKDGGSGTLSITYNSLDELEGILGHIR